MKRPLRWLIVAAVLVAVAAGAWFWHAERRASALIAESETLRTTMLAELLARDPRRPTLGEPTPGVDARTIYNDVIPRMSELDEEQKLLLSLLSWDYWDIDDPPDTPEALAILAQTGPLLDQLRPVLRAPTVALVHSTGAWTDAGHVAHWQSFGEIVAAHVIDRAARGQVASALDLAVLGWHAGLDMARHGRMIDYLVGQGLAQRSTQHIRWILATCEVEPARLAQLAREVDTLWTAHPDVRDACWIEEIYLRELIRRGAGGDLGPDVAELPGMTGFLTGRHLHAEALSVLKPQREKLLSLAAGKPGRDVYDATWRFVAPLTKGGNPVVASVFVVYPSVLQATPRFATHAQLLRVTIALARHRADKGDVPTSLEELVPQYLDAVPTCPYTHQPLRYADGKVWSIGGDGDDDEGSPLMDDDVEEDGDVAYTLALRELQEFPWLEDFDAATRGRVDAWIRDLYRGGELAVAARAGLVKLENDVCGRLISEFKRIADGPGLDSAEGRAKAVVIDATLRAIDGYMERRWRELRRIAADSDPAFVRTIALRWNGWWYRDLWAIHGAYPFGPEDE